MDAKVFQIMIAHQPKLRCRPALPPPCLFGFQGGPDAAYGLLQGFWGSEGYVEMQDVNHFNYHQFLLLK